MGLRFCHVGIFHLGLVGAATRIQFTHGRQCRRIRVDEKVVPIDAGTDEKFVHSNLYFYSYISYIPFTDYVVFLSYFIAEYFVPLPKYIYLKYIISYLYFTDLEVVFFYYSFF